MDHILDVSFTIIRDLVDHIGRRDGEDPSYGYEEFHGLSLREFVGISVEHYIHFSPFVKII